MTHVTDAYLDIWLELVRRERKHNPADRAQVDFDTWESMLVELRERRVQDQPLTPIEAALLGGYIGEALDALAASSLPESAKTVSRATAKKALAAITRVTR
jgi:hypothetical protein